MPLVSFVSAQWTVTTSDAAASSWIESARGDAEPGRAVVVQRAAPGDDRHPEGLRARRRPRGRSRRGRRRRACARRGPVPSRTPTCSRRRCAGRRPGRRVRRSSARMRPHASSATAIAFLPGQFETAIARAEAAARSIVFTPAPARTISARPEAPSISVGSDLRRPDDEHLGAGLGEARAEGSSLRASARRGPRSRERRGLRDRTFRTCLRRALSWWNLRTGVRRGRSAASARTRWTSAASWRRRRRSP